MAGHGKYASRRDVESWRRLVLDRIKDGDDRVYDADATAFLMAMDAMKRRLGWLPKTSDEWDRWWAEVLREAKKLCFRRHEPRA
jgi:hypothetical protein